MGKTEIKTFPDLIRSYFPDADDEECECILWEKTPYPMGNVESIKKQLAVLKETLDAGLKPCDMCNKPVSDGRCCEDCARALNQMRKQRKHSNGAFVK